MHIDSWNKYLATYGQLKEQVRVKGAFDVTSQTRDWVSYTHTRNFKAGYLSNVHSLCLGFELTLGW